MEHLVFDFGSILYGFDDSKTEKSLNLEFIQVIFDYQTTHPCRLAIVTESNTKLVTKILGQATLKLEFDFILSLESGFSKAEKFADAARFWQVNLHDLYYFTTDPVETKQHRFLNPNKVFRCNWINLSTKTQTLKYIAQTRVLNTPNQLALVLPPNCAELVENSNFLAKLQAWAAIDDRQIVVGGIVINAAGKVLMQKRSASRRLFPNCWDISAGGHLEVGETIFQALKRELLEETGLELDLILDLVLIYDWATEVSNLKPNTSNLRREFDFVISCKGDLNNIKIEKDKVSEIRWIGVDELEILKQDQTNDNFVYRLVVKALKYNHNNL